MSERSVEQTERTRLRRLHERGSYDRETIYSILDATPLCHLGYVIEGQPAVIPTFHWREDDHIYWHGSSASRALRACEGRQVCLTVSLLDGLVLARSGFHHSANYRSVMIFGRATKVSDPEEKLEKLKSFVERLYPGRWDSLRPTTDQELKATAVLSMPIEEVSAKTRAGGPVDEVEDLALPIWAGVIPLRHISDSPIPDSQTPTGVDEPPYLRGLTLG